jgi:hypothetical protein
MISSRWAPRCGRDDSYPHTLIGFRLALLSPERFKDFKLTPKKP